MSDASQSTTIRALLAVQRARRSGVFTVQDGETQTRMHLLRGDFVCAEQGAPSDELGLVLVRAKMMTEEQRCAAHAALPKGADDPIRFAQVAVALHILQPAQVPDALALQTRERAIHCLMLERSSWSFREGDEQGSRPGDSPTPIEPLVLAAARRLEPRHLERILALEQDRPVRLLVEAEALAMRFRMNGAQAHFLHRVDGSRTARALCTAASRDLPEAAALLAALVLSGDAELAPEPALLERVRELSKKSAAERAAFWQEQFAKCTRCYACRGACPKAVIDRSRRPLRSAAAARRSCPAPRPPRRTSAGSRRGATAGRALARARRIPPIRPPAAVRFP